MSEKYTLAGAGLVGSLLALFLARKGKQVDIFERRGDMRIQTMSAGRSINLALANRGIAPLKKLGLMPKIEPMLIPMRGRMVHDEDGNTNFQPYGQSEEEVIYSVSRAGLNKLLMDEAESTGNVKIQFNSKLEEVDLDNNTLTLVDDQESNASTTKFEHLIGTDGAGSEVRKAILAKGAVQDVLEPLGHSYKELTIPAGTNGEFQLEKEALHIWPRGGFMLIALPNPGGSFTVTLFMPNQGQWSFDSIDTADKLDDFFDQHFASVKPLLSDLHKEFFENPTGNLATVRCKPWHYQNKALVLGDAAHAIVPFHGQGMNCGFEDCLEFDACLDEEMDIQQLFKKVDELRKPNGDAIADLAIENYVEMRDSVRDPDYLLKKQIAFQLQTWFPQRFTPRYAMVMFQLLPYAEAQRVGEIHKAMLTELSQGIEAVTQLDKAFALQVMEKYLN